MKTSRIAGIIFAVLTTAMHSDIASSQTVERSKSTSMAGTSWLVTVDGESKTRTIMIAKASLQADGVIQLEATYGWTGGSMHPIQAQISQAASPSQLVLTTPADTKIVATERADGSFQGTFALKTGGVKGVVITKFSNAELQAVSKQSSGNLLEKPRADVPAPCAAFFGGWAGEWPIQGFLVLWVTSIDSDCNAKVLYTRSTTPPKSAKELSAATIKGNTLTLPRPDGGTTTFEMKTDSLNAFYRGPSGTNSATMQRVDSGASTQAEQDLKIAMTVIPPGNDVPHECAGFFGNWSGSWAQGQQGTWYLRIVEVRSSAPGCVVRYSYASTQNAIPAKDTAAIRSGAIAFVCNPNTGGTCVFERTGDVLSANYTNPGGGRNSGTFTKTP